MTYLFSNYQRSPISFVRAKGNTLYDQEGRAYLDFSSGIGVTNLGFHPRVQEAVAKQVEKIWHSPNLYNNPLQEEVAALLIGQQDYLAYFCNSGAESNEAAIKLARKATGKSQIISFKNAFHGRTFGAMAATGQPKIQQGFGQMLSGFVYADFNDLESVKRLASEQTAAVMLELVQGESGVRPADPNFVKELASFCQSEKILLIVDEVQTGMGRTGSLYAFEQYGISPDIITLAKGLANGLPVGAMLGRSHLARAFGPGSHGSTFGGNALAMSASRSVIQILQEPGFLKEVKEKSRYLKEELENHLLELSCVKSIRGMGLMLGIEVEGEVLELLARIREKGLIVLTAGQDVIRLLPPLTISRTDIDQAVNILTETFNEKITNSSKTPHIS